MIINTIAKNGVTQFFPISNCWNMNAETFKQILDFLRARFKTARAIGIFIEVITLTCWLRVIRNIKALKLLTALYSDLMAGLVRVVRNGHKVHVGKVQSFFRAIGHALASQETVQVHLTQTDCMTFVVSALNRWHRLDACMICYRGERVNSAFYAITQTAVHSFSNIERTEVAGNIATHMSESQIFIQNAGFLHLKNLRAQVRHGNTTLNRVRLVYRIFEYDIWISGFELNLSNSAEEVAWINVGLLNARIVDHIVVVLGNRHVRERLAVFALYIVWAKQSHWLFLLGQLESNIWDNYAQRKSFNTDFFVRVLALSIHESQDIWMMSAQIDRACTLTSAQLVRVGERILEQLHNRNNTR